MEPNMQGCGEHVNSQEMNGHATGDTPRGNICSAVAESIGVVTEDGRFVAFHRFTSYFV